MCCRIYMTCSRTEGRTSASSSARRISRIGALMFSAVSLPSRRTMSHAFSRPWLRLSNIPAYTRWAAPRRTYDTAPSTCPAFSCRYARLHIQRLVLTSTRFTTQGRLGSTASRQSGLPKCFKQCRKHFAQGKPASSSSRQVPGVQRAGCAASPGPAALAAAPACARARAPPPAAGTCWVHSCRMARSWPCAARPSSIGSPCWRSISAA